MACALAYARRLAGSGDAALCAAIGMTLPLVSVLEPRRTTRANGNHPAKLARIGRGYPCLGRGEPPEGVWINRLVATELTALMRADSEVSVSRLQHHLQMAAMEFDGSIPSPKDQYTNEE